MFRRLGAGAGMATMLLVAVTLSPTGAADEDQLPVGQTPSGPRSVGPDIICSEIFNWENWGEENGYIAVSVGTRSCNIGNMEVSWRRGTQQNPDNRHPVIAQTMYRLQDGRFEQIGQSWLKHGFCAVDGDDFCFTCSSNSNCDFLGIGCSDPYSASLNGTQLGAGPKYQVNPVNGGFPFPPDNPPYTGVIDRRLQIDLLDLPKDDNPGGIGRGQDARYFVGAHYVASDEALTGNDLNNAAYREVEMSQEGIEDYLGDTVPELPAIYAWQDADPQVQIVEVDVPTDGRFYLAFHSEFGTDGLFHYEYALLNYNSDRAAHAFVVPTPESASVSGIGFKDVRYHSGEPFDNTDWQRQHQGDVVRWFGETFANNPDANALRWGTMYNFRFSSDRPARAAMVEIELFKPHATPTVSVLAIAPTPREDVTLDGVVDTSDVMAVLEHWATGGRAADVDRSGVVDVFDLLLVLRAWGT